jgi:hypothetical protein
MSCYVCRIVEMEVVCYINEEVYIINVYFFLDM